MRLVRDEGPGKAPGRGFGADSSDPGEKGSPVGIVAGNALALYPTADDVMQRAGRVYASLSGHAEKGARLKPEEAN